ncbi:ABC transporter permease subunit [Methylophaga sp. OBS4]|uniref:ABC transporter permease subunit n=1 Tax=Methylophaga sp. OBS4 TaxID=2991935 RepID=UPI0022516688|nr:ABC transporter permease subunit [Methylophaga sp. OBS4]MCX4187471.1 ABC transporter permease subunit [Methylophaga sp. OBS4]
MNMQNIWFIMRREFSGYFVTPVAYVFIIIFLLLTGFSTFYVGHFFERGEADLYPFFSLHPWLYILLIPAISMRLWAEERKSGSIELLMTLPVSVFEAVLGKFLAAWAFTGLALMLNFPLWITVNYLGNPDNGVIITSFLGSLLMAGGFLAIGSCISAITKNQVIAFVLSLIISLVFVLSGYGIVIDFFSGWAPQTLVETVSSFSFLTHFDAITKGVIDLRDMMYFISLIAIWLFANALIVNARKAD